MPGHNIGKLPAFDESKFLNVVIEAAKGSRIKLKHDEQQDVFRVHKVLPLGIVFPFDYGFVPSTIASDGDPLDAFVLSESGLPAACVVLGSVEGILMCEQTEKGEATRNDRIIALPVNADTHKIMQPAIAMDDALIQTLGQFLVAYNELQGKKLRIVRSAGPKDAMIAIRRGLQAARRSRATA